MSYRLIDVDSRSVLAVDLLPGDAVMRCAHAHATDERSRVVIADDDGRIELAMSAAAIGQGHVIRAYRDWRTATRNG